MIRTEERTERKQARGGGGGAAWNHRGEERAAQGIFTTCSQTEQGLRGSAPARNVRVTTAENGARQSSTETQQVQMFFKFLSTSCRFPGVLWSYS